VISVAPHEGIDPFCIDANVTGLVARMLSEHPQLTPYEVKTVLRAVASNAERKDGGCNGG
jgi:hypothetical protein